MPSYEYVEKHTIHLHTFYEIGLYMEIVRNIIIAKKMSSYAKIENILHTCILDSKQHAYIHSRCRSAHQHRLLDRKVETPFQSNLP